MEDQREQDQQRWEDQKARDEIKNLRKRFSDATGQLADERPTVRRSGAYAMAALADDWRSLGNDFELKVCIGVLAAYVTTPNPTYTDNDGRPDAGDDGLVRALIVSLLSKKIDSQFQDLWGNYTLLHYADLRSVAFTAPINNVDLFRADLSGAGLTRAPYFEGARLNGVNLTGAKMRSVNLKGADLTFANLTGADMTGVNVSGANLRFAILTDAKADKLLYDAETH